MVRRISGLLAFPLLRRGWFLTLLTVVGVVVSGVVISFTGNDTFGSMPPGASTPTLLSTTVPSRSDAVSDAVSVGSTAGGSEANVGPGSGVSLEPAVDGDWALRSGVISADPLGHFAASIRVVNTASGSRFGLFELTVTGRGGTAASLRGNTGRVAPGQAVEISLFSLDKYEPGPYTTTFHSLG